MNDARKRCIVCCLWRDDDSGSTRSGQLLAVLGIGEKGNVAFASTRERRNLCDKHRTVAPQLSAKPGDDFV